MKDKINKRMRFLDILWWRSYKVISQKRLPGKCSEYVRYCNGTVIRKKVTITDFRSEFNLFVINLEGNIMWWNLYISISVTFVVSIGRTYELSHPNKNCKNPKTSFWWWSLLHSELYRYRYICIDPVLQAIEELLSIFSLHSVRDYLWSKAWPYVTKMMSKLCRIWSMRGGAFFAKNENVGKSIKNLKASGGLKQAPDCLLIFAWFAYATSWNRHSTLTIIVGLHPLPELDPLLIFMCLLIQFKKFEV